MKEQTPGKKFRRFPVWKNILHEITRATMSDLPFLKGSRIFASALVYFFYLLFVFNILGKTAAFGQVLDKSLLSIAPLFAFPVIFTFKAVQVIADREIELERRVLRLRTRLTPRFEIGWTRQRFTDTKNQTDEFLCLTVKNISDAPSDLCGASMIELKSDFGSSIIDPIELQWLGSNGDQPWAQIPSGATRTVKVFRVFSGGEIGFNMSVVPEPFRSILFGANSAVGVVCFDDRYWGGQRVEFAAYSGNDARLEITNLETFPATKPYDPETLGG